VTAGPRRPQGAPLPVGVHWYDLAWLKRTAPPGGAVQVKCSRNRAGTRTGEGRGDCDRTLSSGLGRRDQGAGRGVLAGLARLVLPSLRPGGRWTNPATRGCVG
jgi:hypothetical protein